MIHAFGDSHVWACKPFAVTHHVGGHTMHHVGLNGVPRSGELEIGDTLLSVFGEIDCRCHLGRIAEAAGTQLENIVKPTVMLYCVALRDLGDERGLSRIIVSCVVPPSDNGDAPSVPFWGTLEQRVFVTQMVNAHLEMECQKRGLEFLNFYKSFALKDGSLDPNKSDGLVHIAEKCYGPVREAFERLG